MDFARVFYAGIVVESAARAAVQYGSYSLTKTGSIDGMNQAAQSDAASQGLTGVTVVSRPYCACSTGTETSCTSTCSGSTPGGYVEAIATYTFRPLISYPGIPSSIPLRAAVRFRAQ